jgi:hypothetical protein
MAPDRHLTLLVPSLLGPFDPTAELPRELPELPALERLLGRAQVRAERANTLEQVLMEVLGPSLRPGDVFPAAPLSYFADRDRRPNGFVIRADPVHLRADRDRAILFGPRLLALQLAEAQQLAASFNAHFVTEGLALELGTTERWYVHLASPLDLRTTPLDEVLGRNVTAYLPAGEDAPKWRRILNETQMLFHAHPVNQVRQSQGMLAVNSLWLWGGGKLPSRFGNQYIRLSGEDPSLVGLAKLAGSEVVKPPQDADGWQQSAEWGGDYLHFDRRLRDHLAHGELAEWSASLKQLEADWFAPLLSHLRKGRLASLRIAPADGQAFLITKTDLRRFWRSTRDFRDYWVRT